MDDKNITRKPSMIDVAADAMGFEPDTTVNLMDEPMTPPHGPGQRRYQRHVAIEWEGGVIWLNLFDFVNNYDSDKPHFCIDVRQFNSDGKVKGQGVFTMARGYRGSIGTLREQDQEHMVTGGGWDGGFLVSILTEPDGQERFTDDERTK